MGVFCKYTNGRGGYGPEMAYFANKDCTKYKSKMDVENSYYSNTLGFAYKSRFALGSLGSAVTSTGFCDGDQYA